MTGALQSLEDQEAHAEVGASASEVKSIKAVRCDPLVGLTVLRSLSDPFGQVRPHLPCRFGGSVGAGAEGPLKGWEVGPFYLEHGWLQEIPLSVVPREAPK